MLCFRLFSESSPAVPLADAVAQLREGQAPKDLYAVEPASYQQIPNAPFAYWVSERIRKLFAECPGLEGDVFVARITNGTMNDNRWIRAAWEISDATTGGLRWVTHAKGGAYSPFYSDPHLVIAWDDSRGTYYGYVGVHHRPDVRPASSDYFFRPGLTWSRRTDGLSFRALPIGSIFGDKGPGVFHLEDSKEMLLKLSAVINSSTFKYLVYTQLARVQLAQSFEGGLIQATPIPQRMDQLGGSHARSYWRIRRVSDTATLTSHAFHAPALAPGRKPQPTR